MKHRNILLLVTGMTPQIVTETIWALACDPDNLDKWVPDEVHVLSTQDGINQIQGRLLDSRIFNTFQQDYPELKHIQFSTDSLHLIKDPSGKILSDLKTPEDNEFAANIICDMVRQLTLDPNVSLHVSIAGGRKTMGFYAGYALSLYGRAQDSLSHVLVDEKFEKAVDFYYKTPHTLLVKDRDNKVVGDARDASIWLAKIPFVRMRDAIKDKHQIKSDDDFGQIVAKINESFKNIQLKIDLDRRLVVVNDEFVIDNLPPREFALLHWFADQRRKGTEGIRAPKINSNVVKSKQEDAEYLQLITAEFMAYYDEVKNVGSDFVVDKKFFEGVKSLLKSSLEKQLGLELASKIAIRQEGKEQPFYLDINPTAIEIVNNLSVS